MLRRVRRGANATFACHADAARVAPVLAAPAVCAPGHLLRRAAPPPAAPALLGVAMQIGCNGGGASAGAAAAPTRWPYNRRASMGAFMVASDGTQLPRAASIGGMHREPV